MFGFSQTTFAAPERGASYTIEVGYVKGRGGVVRNVQVQVVEDGTAGWLYAAHLSCIKFEHNYGIISLIPPSTVEGVSRDFSIDPVPTTFDFVAVGVPGTIQVNYRVDSIALEPDETFRLTLTVGSGLPSGAFLVDEALFTILDADGT